MDKIIIGLFGTENALDEATQLVTKMNIENDAIHIIHPPKQTDTTTPNDAERIIPGVGAEHIQQPYPFVLSEADREHINRELSDLHIDSAVVEFYTQSIDHGARLLAVEVDEQQVPQVVDIMKTARASHINDDARNNLRESFEDMIQKTEQKTESAWDDMRQGVDSIWQDLKDAVQNITS